MNVLSIKRNAFVVSKDGYMKVRWIIVLREIRIYKPFGDLEDDVFTCFVR